MLILTRKLEQGIVIDGHITVRLLSIDGERVKLGVEAPRSVAVLREELLQEVAGENQAALAPVDGRELTSQLRHLRAATEAAAE